jgi:hypothetical protein
LSLREEFLDLFGLSIKLIQSLLEETYSELIVYKADDHIVVKRDKIGWNMVIHLLHTLHKDECTV